MNKDDEIREELSDLWCKEITGQLKGSEKIRLQNLIEEREFPFPGSQTLVITFTSERGVRFCNSVS